MSKNDDQDTAEKRFLDSNHQETDTDILDLSLQIQLSATAVATSLLLIFVPNVETISFTAFLVGFLFPFPFAVVTILTMSLTWEILASMIFAFSGFTFPFKILAWLIIGSLGSFARRIGVKYFYEFAVFGGISAFVFDILVTIPTAFIFLRNETAFLSVLYANLILGIAFTISHTLSNALLFGFLPVILRTLLPLLADNHPNLLQIPTNYFEYLDSLISAEKSTTDGGYSDPLAIILLDKKRVFAYLLIGLLLVSGLGFVSYQALTSNNQSPSENPDTIMVNMTIDYSGVKATDTYTISTTTSKSLLSITQNIAIVNYTNQFGGQPYVQAINNVWQNRNMSNYYWTFYINGEWVNTGANSTYLDTNDSILWLYSN